MTKITEIILAFGFDVITVFVVFHKFYEVESLNSRINFI